MSNIVLVRSPGQLIEQGQAGYGWSDIEFSTYKTFDELLECANARNIHIGRRKNQMRRFYNIATGDIIVVPVPRGIFIGVAEGSKSFETGIRYGENRVKVNFFKDNNLRPIKIPRTELAQGLSTRLKIRMSVVYLNEFNDEIQRIIKKLEQGLGLSVEQDYSEHVEDAESEFKKRLLDSIQTGKTKLESGGYGLEKLIKELMTIEGYEAKISAKNKTSDGSDIDIEASRPMFSNFSHKVYIQAKHHTNISNNHGIQQLAQIADDEYAEKIFITTGTVKDETKQEAETDNIKIIEGTELVDWIFEQADKLPKQTQARLGISVAPKFVTL